MTDQGGTQWKCQNYKMFSAPGKYQGEESIKLGFYPGEGPEAIKCCIHM